MAEISAREVEAVRSALKALDELPQGFHVIDLKRVTQEGSTDCGVASLTAVIQYLNPSALKEIASGQLPTTVRGLGDYMESIAKPFGVTTNPVDGKKVPMQMKLICKQPRTLLGQIRGMGYS
ncbi:MAG: hypothetical protein GYA55_03040 [SAR324 cluster bacterium]|uniref:Peptidase C39 domain-containing protein n=1 Tax=SAR324 cluster bacterium TaxID=2024889 RepID=A0A7X9FQ48_9DELT|nr:hypothetical protein [SAR324 cluster bacterium]